MVNPKPLRCLARMGDTADPVIMHMLALHRQRPVCPRDPRTQCSGIQVLPKIGVPFCHNYGQVFEESSGNCNGQSNGNCGYRVVI